MDSRSGRRRTPPDDPAGKDAYDRGYSDGLKELLRGNLRDRIAAHVTSEDEKALQADIDELGTQDMHVILDVLSDLKKASKFERFSDFFVGDHPRTAGAILTIRPELNDDWQNLVARLNEDDRAAILERVPPGTYTGPAAPATSSPPNPAANSLPKAAGDDGSPISIGVTFVPKTIHNVVKGQGKGGQNTDPKAVQVQGQYEFVITRTGKWKFSWSPMVQGQFMYDDGKKKVIGQPMLGGQGTVDTFLAPLVHMQAFVQMLEGATIEVGRKVSGSYTASVVATTQVAVGVQAVFSIPGNKHLQLVLQAQLSGTGSSGQVTVDRSTGIGLQWAF